MGIVRKEERVEIILEKARRQARDFMGRFGR